MEKNNGYKNMTYTVNPNSFWNLIVCITPAKDASDEIEKKLTVMSEYKDAKDVLNKFTIHGKD